MVVARLLEITVYIGGNLNSPLMSPEIVNKIAARIVSLIAFIKKQTKINPGHLLCDTFTGKKHMLVIDQSAQLILAAWLTTIFSNAKFKVYFSGEEYKKLPKGWENCDALGLIDPIDGTDLFAKDLSGWCCAVVIYKGTEILGSFVGMPNRAVYFSTCNIEGARKIIPGHKTIPVKCGRQDRVNLSDTTLAFYGQKVKSFLSITRHNKLLARLKVIEKEQAKKKAKTEPANFRLLNIAGNPMFVKMVDNHCTVGAVIELLGQQPHDVIPGAFIAQKAGAILTDLNGNKINFADYLKDGEAGRLTYIISNSKNTWRELVEILKTEKRSGGKAAGKKVARGG